MTEWFLGMFLIAVLIVYALLFLAILVGAVWLLWHLWRGE